MSTKRNVIWVFPVMTNTNYIENCRKLAPVFHKARISLTVTCSGQAPVTPTYLRSPVSQRGQKNLKLGNKEVESHVPKD